MEVVAPTSQRAGSHYPLLEQCLPAKSVQHLKEKFPTENDVDTFFTEHGALINEKGITYRVQLEWEEDSTQTITALFMRINNSYNNTIDLSVIQIKPTYHFVFQRYSMKYEDPSKLSSLNRRVIPTLNASFDSLDFTFLRLLEDGDPLEDWEHRRHPIEEPTILAAEAIQRGEFPGLSKVQLLVPTDSSSSSSSGPRITQLKKPVPSTGKKVMVLAALILAGGAVVIGIYGTFKVAKWAFNHVREAKANSTFDLSRIKTGDLSQIDSRIVLISSLALGFAFACSKKRALKLLGCAMLAFGGTYYFKPELFQAAK